MESVIVTVRSQTAKFERDMELPSNLPCSELSQKLLETLKVLDYTVFGHKTKLELFSGGRLLDDKKSLDELHIWDGATITVR